MQRLEVSGAVRPLYGSLGVKGLNGQCVTNQCPDKLTAGKNFHEQPIKFI